MSSPEKVLCELIERGPLTEIEGWVEQQMVDAQRAPQQQRAAREPPYDRASDAECAGMAMAYARVLVEIRAMQRRER